MNERPYGKVVGFTDEDLGTLEEYLKDNRVVRSAYTKTLEGLITSFTDKYGNMKIDACPHGTVLVDNACIKTKVMAPYVNGCPAGNWVYGRLTKNINVFTNKNQRVPLFVYLNNKKMFKDSLRGDAADMADVEIETFPVCIHPLPFPSDVKKLDMLLSRDEPPHWVQDSDVLEDIRSMRGGLHEKTGYAVHHQEYHDAFYLLFDDKKDAEYAKQDLKYWDSMEAFDDTKKYLKEELEEPDEVISDERVWDRIRNEKEWFWDDINERYPSYIGVHQEHDRWSDNPVETPTGTVFPALTKDDYQTLVFVKEEDIL